MRQGQVIEIRSALGEFLSWGGVWRGEPCERLTPTGHADPIDTPVYDQDALTADRVIAGPAIVTTENTTFLVEPGWRLEPTAQGAVWFLQD